MILNYYSKKRYISLSLFRNNKLLVYAMFKMVIENFYLLTFLGTCYNSEVLCLESMLVGKGFYNYTNKIMMKNSKEYSFMDYSTPEFENHDSQLIKHRMNVDGTVLDSMISRYKLNSIRNNHETYVNKIYLKGSVIPSQNVFNLSVENERKANITFEERAREDAYNKTDPTENPYSVLLVMKSGSEPIGICSGSLLTDQWVLTAAHCLASSTVTTVEIYAGGNSYKEVAEGKPAPGGQILNSKEFFKYESFKSHRDGDVALIKTDGKFELTNTVNTVKLSSQPWTYHSYYSCKVTGFGNVRLGMKSSDDQVRKTHILEVKSPCLCSFRLKFRFGSQTSERFLCSRPKEDYGFCMGDSGGGLICDGEVKGLVMQMIKLKDVVTCKLSLLASMECGSVNGLSIFQNTCPFVTWINGYVKLYNDSEISPKCVTIGKSSTSRPCLAAVIIFLWSIYHLNPFIKYF